MPKTDHPLVDLYQAKESIQRTVNLNLGGGKGFKIEPGSFIRVSKPYEGQLGGRVVMVEPYGSKDGQGQQGASTFTILTKELDRYFRKADPNKTETMHDARDATENKAYAETTGKPGRRGAEQNDNETKNAETQTESTNMQPNYIDLAANQDIVNFKQTIRERLDTMAHAAIENIKYDNSEQVDDSAEQFDENVEDQSEQIDETAQQDDDQLQQIEEFFEYIDSMDDAQLNEYIENLDEQQLDLFEELLNERYVNPEKTRKSIAREARAGKDMGKPGKMFKVIAKKAGKRYGSKEIGEKVAGAVLQNIAKKKK